jgi:hypothetical protein
MLAGLLTLSCNFPCVYTYLMLLVAYCIVNSVLGMPKVLCMSSLYLSGI